MQKENRTLEYKENISRTYLMVRNLRRNVLRLVNVINYQHSIKDHLLLKCVIIELI